MANIFDGFLKQIATGDSIKDYKHASRLFVDNNYARSPKYDWLYHVFFDVDSTVSNLKNTDLTEAGMLVKGIQLPKYDIDLKVQNNYNRKELIQTKLNYNSITITFHDDQSEIVRNLWYDYYTHYYRDNDGGYEGSSGGITKNYHLNNKYQPRQGTFYNNFGYQPAVNKGPALARYFEAIRIYSLHQKRFSEYTLINPIITTFAHGDHNASGNGILEHQMTISFTTVLYAGGYVSPNTVKGFADLHYDKSPSPLTPAGGGTNSILGPGGILSAVDSIIGEASGGNFGSAAFTAFRAFNKNRNVDLKGLAKGELIQITKDILRQDPQNFKDGNPLQNVKNKFFIPSAGALANTGFFGLAASPATTTSRSPLEITGTGSLTSNGQTVTGLPGVGEISSQVTSALSGFPSAVTNVFGSISSTVGGAISGAPLNKILNFSSSGGQISPSSELTSPEFSGFSGKLGQIGKNILGSSSAFADQVVRSASGVTSGLVAAAPGIQQTFQRLAPTFLAGTNQIAQAASNVLSQTPHGNKNITKQLALANEKASEFISSGDLQNLVDQRIPTATNPMNISGSIPS